MISEENFLRRMNALQRQTMPSLFKVLAGILISGITLTLLIMWYVPWQQSAFGTGVIATQNPNQRIQAISALVGGQVKEWHVYEGQAVAKDDPIVTLVDTDPTLIERLENQIKAANLQKEALERALSIEQNNLSRQQRLSQQGLSSQRDIENASVTLQNTRVELAKAEAQLNRLSVEKARQSLQTKTAPDDGFVVNLRASGPSTFVQAGEVIASFVPANVKRSVVISVGGIDAPLVKQGQLATLQFEGWPAILFSGWPGLSRGTFTGVVSFVEPYATAQGQFKVWIDEDPNGAPWPDARAVRLGSRVQGWVLLEEVRLGYELWRQLNNFPAEREATAVRL